MKKIEIFSFSIIYYTIKISSNHFKMSSRINFWVLRQNYGEITNQLDMKKIIMEQQIVTCPWGGWGLPRQNVIDAIYNEYVPDKSKRGSSGQDRRFVEDMEIGDIVLIPFSGKKECIVARITSDVEYAIDTGFYWKETDAGKITIDDIDDGLPFRPVGRRIQIIDDKFIPKKQANRLTLSKMKTMKNDLVVRLDL
jgi:hypothetical protein